MHLRVSGVLSGATYSVPKSVSQVYRPFTPVESLLMGIPRGDPWLMLVSGAGDGVRLRRGFLS